MSEHPLKQILTGQGAVIENVRGLETPVHYGDPEAEYARVAGPGGIYIAFDRGAIDITGKDRAAWLHNLVTNTVKNLQPGEGNYTFAVNVKGRILFDGNVIVLNDRIRLDVDRRYVEKAITHLKKYCIMEDVKLTDVSSDFVRVAIVGESALKQLAAFGAGQAVSMAAQGSTHLELAGQQRLLVRNDFAGVPAAELYLKAIDAQSCWDSLKSLGLEPLGFQAIDTRRMEAGIPLYGVDIDEENLPAETGQFDRTVSFTKGCYLGQEIVERMRSRGSVARKLVGIRLEKDTPIESKTPFQVEGKDAGIITSSCWSPATRARIALGYAKSVFATPGVAVSMTAGEPNQGTIASLPSAP